MGALSKLIDPSAVHDASLVDTEMDRVDPAEMEALRPSASATMVAQGLPVEPDVKRVDARAALDAEAGPSASAEVALRADADVARPEEPGDADVPSESAELDGEQAAAAEPSPTAKALAGVLALHRWSDVESDEPQVRARALAQQFFMRRLISSGSGDGREHEMRQVWEAYAPADAPAFDDMLSRRRSSPRAPVPATVPSSFAPPPVPTDVDHPGTGGLQARPPSDFDSRPETVFPQRPSPASVPAPPPQADSKRTSSASGAAGSGFGLGLGDLVKAPFQLLGAAGSMVLAGLGQCTSRARGAYVRSRVSGHQVLGEQLQAHASAVVDLSAKLKERGMGDLIDAIRKTGAPTNEVFAGMKEGGQYDALGKRYDKLMKQPGMAETYAAMQDHIAQFDTVARRYAKTGVELNVDHDSPIRAGSEAMVKATEGMPHKDGGTFKQLADTLREMTDRIAQMIQRLFSRFAPA
ncbi:MAG: hypothetical protein EPN79_15785 [Burkholderiaceae bacterium]|nr:MAG: hypothetical protein EPN79_15785 [Burkholderiaceae bacterium]